jgi:hypothetical protein
MFRIPSKQQLVTAIIFGMVLALFGFLLSSVFGINATMHFVNGMFLGGFLGALAGSCFVGSGSTTAQVQNATSTTQADSGSGEVAENKTIFVGNLAFKANSEQLRALFAQYGEVQSVRIMTDRLTRRPRGFAFVEMEGNGALRAIQALNGFEFFGRELRVNEGHNRRNDSDNQEPLIISE